jgi:hypothetical protein
MASDGGGGGESGIGGRDRGGGRVLQRLRARWRWWWGAVMPVTRMYKKIYTNS